MCESLMFLFWGRPDFILYLFDLRFGYRYTMSPQVLKGEYTSQSDLWAVGVIAYMLLSSTKPFYKKNMKEMMHLIMKAEVSFESPTWFFHISANAKDFVQKLLLKDPDQRMNARDASNHPWITDREQLPDELPSPEVLDAIDDSLINYQNTSQLKKLALIVIAHRSSSKEILELRKVFDTFDTRKDGTLSAKEFKDALLSIHFPESDIDSVFSAIVR
jgi:serine/threonine protein kinase